MNAPKLRFKEFTKSWNNKKLDHLLVESKEKSLGDENGIVLTSSRKGLFPRSTYFDGREDENTVGYSLVPKDSFTYRQMSDDHKLPALPEGVYYIATKGPFTHQ